MKNKNKYITVLDFELGRVFQYKVEPLWKNMRPRTDYEGLNVSVNVNGQKYKVI